MATSKKTTKREVLILVRYTIKKDYAPKGLHTGDVVLLVRNDQGKEYYVTLRRNRAHSCTCTGNAEYGKRCYHINEMVAHENVHYAARKAAKLAQLEDKLPTQEVVLLDDKRRERDILDAPLTRNSGFSLLRVS